MLLKEDVGPRIRSILLENRARLPNVLITTRWIRYYPWENLASHVLGYVGRMSPREWKLLEPRGYCPDSLVGKAGVEKVCEPVLRGRPGELTLQVDALGWPQDEWVSTPARKGHDVELTLDLDVQSVVERELDGRRGAVVVLDAVRGDVLALASSPDYDPNLFTRVMSRLEWRRLRDERNTPLLDRAVEAEYQPGSTFKIVTALTALWKGVIPRTGRVITCPGWFRLGKRTAFCWKRSGHGRVDFLSSLAWSCNVYYYTVALDLSPADLCAAAVALGLGRPTGVGLPGEKAGVVPDSSYRRRRARAGAPWTKGDTVNMAIGQGDMLVTPLQMALLMARIVSGRLDLRPRLFLGEEVPSSSLGGGRGAEHGNQPPPGLAACIGRVRRALLEVVRRGTGRRASVRGVTVIGKTGSAQNPAGDTHAWFVGGMLVPGRPVAIAVMLENAGAGGAVAAPLAGAVFRELLDIWRSRGLVARGSLVLSPDDVERGAFLPGADADRGSDHGADSAVQGEVKPTGGAKPPSGPASAGVDAGSTSAESDIDGLLYR